ncbi:MAG: SDR family oxidoreductase [Geothrix sp.]|nr:SDR family oxidoreductase [Geothrix sp.]
MAKLNGKIALITGGTTGIGLAAAKRFHEAGARVFVSGRNPKTLDEARKVLSKDVELILADSGKLPDLDRLVSELKTRAGRIDVLFVNAGIANFLPAEAADEAHWDDIMNVNLKGPFFLAQKALPLLGKGASVLFTTSVAGQRGFASTAVYTTSKAGLAGLARVLAAEWAPRGIRVNSIAPGPIATPIYSKLGLPAKDLAGFELSMQQRVPLHRFGVDDEVAKAALFLASDDASFITGEELFVDGGLAIA